MSTFRLEDDGLNRGADYRLIHYASPCACGCLTVYTAPAQGFTIPQCRCCNLLRPVDAQGGTMAIKYGHVLTTNA